MQTTGFQRDNYIAALLIPGAETILERLEGPNSGSLRSSTGKISYFDTPREGGVYKIGVSYGGSPTTETVLVLPLSGASVDAVVLADIGRAEDAVAYMNSHYSAMQRQRPAFGLQWFNNNGMGDYLGRVDSVARPTTWLYNQVNDDTGMGAVATWRGLPIRIAKLSNFLVGYATKRIGVWSVSRALSQGIGTSNDTSATLSWDAGVSVANGAEYDPTVSSMVTNAWRVGDQKVKRLWPNNSESDNHASGLLPINYNTQFISPGFTERRP